MSAEKSFGSMESFLQRMNDGFVYPTHVLYERIGDPVVRAAVRTGELIAVAATSKGVDLQIPRTYGADEWLLFLPKKLLTVLNNRGRDVAEAVLADAKEIAQNSRMNGDRQNVLKNLNKLILDQRLRPTPGFNGWT